MPRKLTGRPSGRPKTPLGPRVTSVRQAAKSTGIPARVIHYLLNKNLSKAWRHGRIYCGQLRIDYKKHFE
jgi:hypothetical protein